MQKLDFDVKAIFQERLASSFGLDKYQYIIEKAKKINIATDTNFQRIFNGFYMVRRNETWRKSYYSYFEAIKNKHPSFENIITFLYDTTGNIEPSFSSKMLATLSPEKPIWDKYVVQNLGLQLDGTTKQEKLQNAILLYEDIEKWYAIFLSTKKATECINLFNQMLPDYKWVSNTKKIDCILWSIR